MKRILLAILSNLIMTWGFTQDFWEGISIPDSLQYRCMEMSENGDIYLGMWGFTYPGGVYRSTDNAQNWQYLGLDEKPIYTLEVCLNGDIIAGVYNGIYKSNDYGLTWYQVYFTVGNITTILSLENGYVFAGGVDNLHGIIRSLDFGETWDTVHIFANYGEENLEALTVSSEGMIAAGTYNVFGDGSIWFTTDLGETWTEVETPYFPPYWPWVFSLAFHPQGDLFAGFYGCGLYRYSFTTQQWTLLTDPGTTPDDILFIGENKILVGLEQDQNCYGGVLYSEDGGENFELQVSGMNGGNGTSISYLFRNPSNFIYALGLGFYRSTIPLITEIEKYPEQRNILTTLNTPNPFSLFTKITWLKTNSPEVLLMVISVASGEVIFKESIINTGNFVFRAYDLEPGIYFYSITDRNNLYSGKMILI